MSSSEQEKNLFQDYDHYKEYRDLLIDGEQKVSEGLDKAILAISSAALGLSFSFSRVFLKDIEPVALSYLQNSWFFLGLSLTSVLLSLSLAGLIYYLNRVGCDKIMQNRSDIISSIQNKNETHPIKIEFKEPICLKRINLLFHFLAPVLLILGIICVGIFLKQNLGVKSNGKEISAAAATCSGNPCISREKDTITTTATTTAKSRSNRGEIVDGKKASTSTSTEASETKSKVEGN